MRMRYFIFGVAIIIFLGALAGVIRQRTMQRVRNFPAEVEKDIRDHLPIGSSRAEVTAYLDDQRISHSYVSESAELEHSNYELATIRVAAYRWPVRTEIQIYFNFDDKQKLVSYSVQEVSTGP